MSSGLTRSEQLKGCLLGMAIGDALGLPYEGLLPRRALKLFGPPDRFHLLGSYGLVSDDTEHACITAQAIISSGGNTAIFCRELAWRLRFWLLGLPAGIGFATLRALLKLWLGFPPNHSGVFSAGNGPAMRAPMLGVAIKDREILRELVRVSTRLTHTDPKAEQGAWVIALTTRLVCESEIVNPEEFLTVMEAFLGEEAEELLGLLRRAVASVGEGESTREFARSLGLERGITGYIFHTVPMVIHAWLSHPRDYTGAIQSLIECGGDTDSTAAIAGGILGASLGMSAIPRQWLSHLGEWPRTVRWMERLADTLAVTISTGQRSRPPGLPLIGLWLRNLGFLAIVLGHGLRRLAPPY
ncbi:ADP-ribosylglycohydrolase family protein [Pannus brasiliensis CCIBt3594]|uniref:ADP-ribosylglycohydrolase family protein n=1 Tax=Pannus brasiliensis CCIBt3594 TaxID=1427578 RepID=A0AAW9QWV8_9CHRO